MDSPVSATVGSGRERLFSLVCSSPAHLVPGGAAERRRRVAGRRRLKSRSVSCHTLRAASRYVSHSRSCAPGETQHILYPMAGGIVTLAAYSGTLVSRSVDDWTGQCHAGLCSSDSAYILWPTAQ